jgi:iron complex transport system substrate-binding protein
MNRLAAFLAITVVIVAFPVATGSSVPSSAMAQSATPADCSFPFSKTDATGTEVVVESEPKRVVALQPSAAQTMWEIGAKEKVVGMPVNQYTAYLNGSKKRTDITKKDGYSTSIEKVVSQKPDLVLAPNIVSNGTVKKLRSAGLTVYKFRPSNSIDNIYKKTVLTGKLVGACQGATERVARMKETVSSIRSAVEGRERPSVLYLLGGGYTAGNGTFINEIIRIAGGDNLAANAGITGYKKINPEVVIKRNPQWIVIGSNTPQIPNKTAYRVTTALKKNQTVTLNSNYLNQPAPRVVIPMKKLARTLHPKAFEQTNATATTETGTATTETGTATTGTSTATMTETETGTTTEMTDSGTATPQGTEASGPGFGVVVAAIALVAAALFARMRARP